MIVDVQHHFTPRGLFKEDLGDRRVLQQRYPGRFGNAGLLLKNR